MASRPPCSSYRRYHHYLVALVVVFMFTTGSATMVPRREPIAEAVHVLEDQKLDARKPLGIAHEEQRAGGLHLGKSDADPVRRSGGVRILEPLTLQRPGHPPQISSIRHEDTDAESHTLDISNSNAKQPSAIVTGRMDEAQHSNGQSGADVDSKPSGARPFPRNLHRVYDGNWDVVSISDGVPFATVPLADAPRDDFRDQDHPRSADGSNSTFGDLDRTLARAFSNTASRPLVASNKTHDSESSGENGLSGVGAAPDSATQSMAFEKQAGFALLTAENHESPLGEDINVVLGELLIRDGPYRTPRDVTMRLLGVYQWAIGRITVVGDVYHEEPEDGLSRLYHAFISGSSEADRRDFLKRNITESSFTTALTPTYSRYRKPFRNQQRSAAPLFRPSVTSQCPFTLTLSVVPGSFDDRLPTAPEFSSLPLDTPAAQGIGKARSEEGLRRGVERRRIAPMIAERGGTLRLGGPSPTRLTSTPVRVSERDTNSRSSAPQAEYVEMSGLFVSERCKTKLNMTLSTLDTEMLFGKAINYTLLVTFVAFAQVVVLIRQMEMTSTQAAASRVSLMTIGLQAVADSYLCLGHLTMGIAVPTLFNAFATAAFFKFIIFSIFEMRYMLLIWKARRPSGFSEGWEAMRRELSMLYSRFYGSLLVGIILLYQLQNNLRYFVFALYSFWTPQIVLSVVQDHRKPLHPLYILGMSVTRMAIPLYFWSCPRNFLHIQPRFETAVALAAWVFFQALVLLSQHLYGPRWFVPKPLLPEKYDYFRPVQLPDVRGADDCVDLEAGHGEPCQDENGDSVSGQQQPLLASTEVECVICMTPVDIHARDRMVTPCNHFFHAACLEQWLNVKLECAVCRSAVPPP